MPKAAVSPASIPVDERVEVFIPRAGANEDPNYYVSVNGKNFILPRGKKSVVPRYIADEIARSQAAQEALDERRQAMIDAAQVM